MPIVDWISLVAAGRVAKVICKNFHRKEHKGKCFNTIWPYTYTVIEYFMDKNEFDFVNYKAMPWKLFGYRNIISYACYKIFGVSIHILATRGKIFCEGKVCRTIQVRAIARKYLVNKLQSVHMSNTFLVYLWILTRKILVNNSQFTKFANFSPTKIFRCTIYVYIKYNKDHLYKLQIYN